MTYQEIIYEPGTVARVILNRPQYYNAQSRLLLDEMDDAFAQAARDERVRVIVVSGNGKHFCAGHDIGTPEDKADRKRQAEGRTVDRSYLIELSRERFVEKSLRWRNLPKPTIAMIHGYCIYGGWLIAATMDIIFASDDAMFLPSNLQYFTIPWDIGAKKAKEILFECRFIPAEEARELGFVNRVVPRERLEEETLAYANRVAENHPPTVRNSKFLVNQALDLMGFTNAVISGFQSYSIGILPPKEQLEEEIKRTNEQALPDRSKRQLGGVALALKHSRAPEAKQAGR